MGLCNLCFGDLLRVLVSATGIGVLGAVLTPRDRRINRCEIGSRITPFTEFITMSYSKPKVLSKSSPQLGYAAGCPTDNSYMCKTCFRQ